MTILVGVMSILWNVEEEGDVYFLLHPTSVYLDRVKINIPPFRIFRYAKRRWVRRGRHGEENRFFAIFLLRIPLRAYLYFLEPFLRSPVPSAHINFKCRTELLACLPKLPRVSLFFCSIVYEKVSGARDTSYKFMTLFWFFFSENIRSALLPQSKVEDTFIVERFMSRHIPVRFTHDANLIT